MILFRGGLISLTILLLCVSCAPSKESLLETPAADDLPVECESFNPDAYGPVNNCRHVVTSPDQTTTAYVIVKEREYRGYFERDEMYDVQVVKLIEEGQTQPVEIYRQSYFTIGALEWLSDGRLLIWDTHYDLEESPGITILYDPEAGGIVRRLKYPLHKDVVFWNEPRSAFYSVIFLQFPCSAHTGGYDFARDHELPSFGGSGESDQAHVVGSQHTRIVGNPVWSEDSTQLLVSVSYGTLIDVDSCGIVEWDPSSIVMLDLATDDLQPVLVQGDSEHNYYLQQGPEGEYEIIGETYAPSYERCCRGW
ncbi:MAG: hypothetical protein ACP5J4_13185 [Anaerolineae bacterium]